MRIVQKSRRTVPLAAPVVDLVNKITDTPDDELAQVLSEIDAWKWPRSDLNAWIKVLNKFDAIMEDIIREYAVDTLQRTPFSAFHKKLLGEILRFERLLLENSTNRKTYCSYDRLNALMTTSDLDILILSLNLLLRPAQQYSAQPSVSSVLGLNTSRLSSLVKRWPNLHDFDLPLTSLCSGGDKSKVDELKNEAREVVFKFYKKDSSQGDKEKEKSSPAVADEDIFNAPPPPQTPKKGGNDQPQASSSSGPVSIHIDSATLESKDTMEIWADVIETYHVPDDEKFDLLCRIRSAQVLTPSHEADREKLLLVRLLAIALFCHTHTEQIAFNNLFLYEPDIVIHIAELLQLDRGVDVQVQTAAVYALDAIGRYRNKIQDVLAAVNAGVNHGVLMALLRKTIGELAQEESNLPQPFVESLLAFVTYIAAHASGGNMVVSAGLVPLLVQVIDIRLPNRLYALSKTMQLLDNVLYGYTNAFQLFCNARGVDVLVGRIEYEVNLGLEEHGGDKPASPIPVPYGKVSVNRGAALKHILRSMHRMMQSSGTTEGLRGLLDSSLLQSAKKIMENRGVFGPNALAIAINIMTTFVHNEPTCLTVIQEAGLPEVLYNVIEAELEPVIEVIQAVANALGALCLNQAGQDGLTARPKIIPSIFAIFTSEKHQRVLQEKENAVLIGTTIEELIRHHPSLKDAVLDSIKATMAKIEELGNAFVIPDEHKEWYYMQAVQPAEPAPAAAAADDSNTDVEMTVASSSETPATPTAPIAPAAAENLQLLEESSRHHENPVISYMDAFNKFLEGYFQHVPHCRDFVANGDGLEHFARLTALPCIPYDFPNSVASDSLVQVVRTMVEASTSEALAFVVKMVTDSLEETKDLRDDDSGESKFSALATASAADLPAVNEKFRKLVTLHVRVMLLSDILATASYAQGRASVTLLEALCGPSANNALLSLGSLHRCCLWENVLLRVDETPEVRREPREPQEIAPAVQLSALSSGVSTPLPTGGEANGAPVGDSSSPTPKPESSEPKVSSTQESNIRALKHLASQIPYALAPFYQSIARLFQTRRGADQAQKQKVSEAAAILAEVLLKHLKPKVAGDDKRPLYAYYSIMLGLSNMLLTEDRSQSKIIHTVLMLAFFRKSGLEAITTVCRILVEAIETASADPTPFDERPEPYVQALFNANGALKVALHLLLPIVTFKCTLDSPQTPTLATPGKKETDPGYFESHSFVIRMRLAVVPIVREIWQAQWLSSMPLPIIRSAIQIVLELLNTDHEDHKDATPEIVAPGGGGLPRTVGPDENRIQQLTDMGFPRAAAERALMRTRNNISAATELLLSQPLPLPFNEPAAAPEPPAPEPAAEDTEPDVAEPIGETAPVAEPEASSSDATPPAVAEPEPVAPEEPVEVKSSEEWLNEFRAAREPLKDNLGQRALTLVDSNPSLVFDVQKVFVGTTTADRDQGVRLLIEDIKKFSTEAYDHQEQPMAVRCRLLALVLNDPTSSSTSLSESESKSLMEVLMAVLLSNPMESGRLVVPKWLASHLLVTEALLLFGEEPRTITLPKEDEPLPEKQLFTGPPHLEARARIFDFCLRLISIPTLPRDELLAALRLFVLLTRDHAVAVEFVKKDGVSLLFKLLKASPSSSETNGAQPYIACILRHIVEDNATLQRTMHQEIKTFLSHPRNRNVDIVAFTRNCSSMALRSPTTFIQTASGLCQLGLPYSHVKTISLKTEAGVKEQTEANSSPDEKGTEMHVDQALPTSSGQTSESLETLVHFLVAELIKSVKGEGQEPIAVTASTTTVPDAGPSNGGESSSDATQPSSASASAQAYPCFIMQCLTELLFSYDSCKVAFLSYSPKKRTHTPAKDSGLKHRTAALHFLISELMSFGTINPTPPSESKRQVTLCNWAMSVVVALCVDVSPTEIKDVPPERASVRRFVLEAINRAIKDPPASETGEARYSRLLALADLCYRLLTVRFNAGSRKANDETPTHISKIMLEKNFVATLTNALAEVDPNFPNIRGVVTGILRPLEYLTKIAIRMSRISDKHKDSLLPEPEEADSDISEDEEETEDGDRDETPDLYRNSSLGIFAGEMEEVNFDHDDEMDEDAEEEEEDAEMDYENESQDSSNTDEEDEAEMEEDLENETGESEEGWHDEDEEDDLVQNDVGHADESEEGDHEEGDEEDDEDEGEGDALWEDVAAGPGTGNENPEMIDGVVGEPIPIIHEEEGDMSEADGFEDDLDVFVPDDIPAPAAADLLAIGAGFADAFGGAPDYNPRDVPQVLWQGMVRSGRRRANEDDMEIFGRTRNGTGAAPEGAVHPLLQDPLHGSSQSRGGRRVARVGTTSALPQDLLQSIEHMIGEGAVQLFQHIFTGRGGAPGTETFRIDIPTGGFIPQLNRHGRPSISTHIRVDRTSRANDTRSDVRSFEPLLTLDRWAEEVKTLHGRFEQSRASKLANHLALELLPAAIENYKQAQEAEKKEAERRREAQAKAEEEETKRLREERDEKERQEAEKARLEHEQVAAAAAAATAETEANEAQPAQVSADEDTEMADAESHVPDNVPTGDEAPAEAESGPSHTVERVTVTIHGQPVDITDTGIDPTFLEALPDDMREEVLNQHLRDQRAARVERPSDSQISPEFLDALPPELRAEIIQQENIERARRGAEQNNTTTNEPPVPADMDAADFIASLDPQLRQVVLMDSEDGFIQSLPPHMLAEAGLYRDVQQGRRARAQPGAAAASHTPQQAAQVTTKAPVARDAIQLLDKHAIAVLIRLLFFPQVLRKNILSKVLVNLSENSRTRTDIFNLLLGILHDGTGDLSSIDKSFAQMSFRNSKASTPATPRPASKTSISHSDVVPELVAQRCLEALSFVTGHNEASSVFFLTEQELPAGLRRTTSKKGKGKEKQNSQTYYPIVLLLGQLDRQALLRTPTLMEAIVGLLALVTRPLAGLKDSKEKDASNEPSSSIQASAAQSTETPAAAPNTSSTPEATAIAPSSDNTATAQQQTPSNPQQQTAPLPSAQEKVILSQPPAIPAPVLCFVVNILTTGECSGRAFSNTLSLIQHLSFIPGARDIIAQELCTRAQQFGQELYKALDDLASALHDSRDEDVTIAIASKFSPASSDQAKLLRLLKTIDYMYSPKSIASSAEHSTQDVEKVQSIYEGFRFTSLWRRLGDCLAVIEEKAELEHIATVLLPLIESLMVVCKYVGPKANSTAIARTLRTPASPKTPTTARESMEELFVTFTDAHRKMLNLMVRNNPSLMSGSFSLLVNNPRVLDFDNKRNYFNQQLHRRPATREHYNALQLNVRRNRVFEDSFQYLQRKTGDQIKYGKLSVRFMGEEGVDAGGVTREWFQILARQMFNPDYCLFQPCAADRLTYQPNKASSINPEHLSFFKFVGRIIGKAIYDGRLLDAYFARSLYRQILGKPVDYRDVEWIDPEYYKSLCWILENDPTLLEITFSVEADEFGVMKIVELKENGATIPVTQENKREFVQLSAQWRLYSSIKDQIEALLGGFYEIIPKELITIFDEKELELLISGTPDIDVDEWRAATEYNGYTSSDPAIVWFWRALKSFNREERAKVLSFATGTSRVPLGGFVDLQGVQGTQRFSIHRAYGEVDRLPQAHTCFNQIDLPQYSSYEMLRQQLLLAIHEGGEGFGFA